MLADPHPPQMTPGAKRPHAYGTVRACADQRLALIANARTASVWGPSHTTTALTAPVCTAMLPRQGHDPAPAFAQTLTVLSLDPLPLFGYTKGPNSYGPVGHDQSRRPSPCSTPASTCPSVTRPPNAIMHHAPPTWPSHLSRCCSSRVDTSHSSRLPSSSPSSTAAP